MARVAEAAPAPSPSGEPVTVDPPPDAASPGTFSGIDASAPQDAAKDVVGVDARACEPGWPTTKGMVCTSDGGPDLCCHRGNETPVCCPRPNPQEAP